MDLTEDYKKGRGIQSTPDHEDGREARVTVTEERQHQSSLPIIRVEQETVEDNEGVAY